MRSWQHYEPFYLPVWLVKGTVRRLAEGIRLWYWRTFSGWHIGKNVRVHWSVRIPRCLRLTLGDDVRIAEGCEIWSEVPGAVFVVGKGSNIARRCMLDVSGGLTIGSDVTISEEVAIYTHSHGRDPRRPPRYFPLEIGDRAWICTRALVLASTRTIGAGAIVGPLEVVRRPVGPGAIFVTRHHNAGEPGDAVR